MERISNAQFAQNDAAFRKACDTATVVLEARGIKQTISPNSRQASKYRNGKGIAYNIKMGTI